MTQPSAGEISRMALYDKRNAFADLLSSYREATPDEARPIRQQLRRMFDDEIFSQPAGLPAPGTHNDTERMDWITAKSFGVGGLMLWKTLDLMHGWLDSNREPTVDLRDAIDRAIDGKPFLWESVQPSDVQPGTAPRDTRADD